MLKLLKLSAESTTPKTSFFDLKRAVIVRESPSLRLRKAAIEGNIESLKRLVKMVPNIQNPDPENGYTTLMYAAKHGHTNLVNLLLDLGHEDEVISVDNEGITVLMIAIMYNQEEIFYSYVSKYPECIHAISKNGCSALLVAAQNGNANLVGSLLSISADIDHVDNSGNSALHYATAYGHPTVMELLISEGCNVDLENNDHFTAANFAYSFGIKELLKDLSERIYNTDSAASISSSYKQSFLNTRTYPSSISSNPPLNTTIISRGPSHGTVESPTPRASTSSSSVPFSSSAIPIMNSSNSVASHFYITGTSPSSFHDDHNERARKGSVDSRSPKGRY